jgi:16S rRNA (cytosine967-C5)-methyltransferase
VKTKKKDSRADVSPARAAAFDILLRIERESSYASELLHSRAYDSLTTVDHALTTELVMGVLRWKALLDRKISEVSSLPLSRLDLEILAALRLAVYQLRWLSRIPARAAINESVELVKRARKRSAAPFVNAVLRKIATEPQVGVNTVDSSVRTLSPENLAENSSHPLWLVKRWIDAYGIEAATKICHQDQAVAPTAIRLRSLGIETQLHADGLEIVPGSFLASARIVRDGDIARSVAVRTGQCVIQDEASQLVAALVGQGTSILDCCAAPGGKTLAVADRNSGPRVVAVDIHPHRARLLRRLLHAAEDENAGALIGVVAADARHLPFESEFDRVLADVPCSGTGTLSRNPEIKWRLVPEDLADLQVRQIAILRSALSQVAPKGRLVYSTCSLEREENEDVVEAVIAENTSFRVIDCSGELEKLKKEGVLVCDDFSALTSGPYLRTLPGVHPCDGFFAAILERV